MNNSRKTQEIAHNVILRIQKKRREDLIACGELVIEDNEFEEPTLVGNFAFMKDLVYSNEEKNEKANK